MIYIQLIGLLAFCILVLSFYKKNIITLLVYQSTACFIYAIHFFLLGALTGAYINMINVIRSIIFTKYKNKILVPIFILLYLIVTLVFYENIFSIFPLLGTTAYLIFMPMNSRKHLLIGEILSASLWLIYSIFVVSYSGIITEIILIISNTILLIRLRK